MKHSTSSSISISLAFVILTLAVATASAAAMAGAADERVANYLVYVDPAPPGVDCQTHQLGILAAALGSEEKAKASIVYNYKNVVSGFSARLTPSELEAVKKQPQVNRVMPSATLQLMSSNFEDVS
ncbi:subtilisin-like protease SBT3.17 [Phragmites australis]|uniref:subtilisin-like protease SBT3.17 n=1 Tax=Phragmites australis TaxID=29695 RepID=UPI002D7958E0|nr:subtilisin-like protease SBT3.17 [Phragmites australis]